MTEMVLQECVSDISQLLLVKGWFYNHLGLRRMQLDLHQLLFFIDDDSIALLERLHEL